MANLNHEFGRVVNGEIEYAPSYFWDGQTMIVNPTAEQYAAHGYYPLAHNQPLESASDGYHWERLNSQVVDGAIYDNWTQIANPQVVRTCTPLALIRVLTIVGQWTTVRAALKAAGEDVYEQFIASIEIKEDDPGFVPFLSWARQQFGDAMLDKMLDAAARGTEYVNGLTAEDFAVEVTNG